MTLARTKSATALKGCAERPAHLHDHEIEGHLAWLELLRARSFSSKSFLITRYPQLLRHGTKQKHTGCFCGFKRGRAKRCNFKRGSARPSLRFFTEQRISAGRR